MEREERLEITAEMRNALVPVMYVLEGGGSEFLEDARLGLARTLALLARIEVSDGATLGYTPEVGTSCSNSA